MFFSIAWRNAKRSRSENLIYFLTMVTAIATFYIVLSLGEQDVMRFLSELESDAVDRLLTKLLPTVYLCALLFVFSLVIFANKYQLECRSRELGLYLLFGMTKPRLFIQIMAEGLISSLLALLGGLICGGFLSEISSLATARLVGYGIIAHQSSFSIRAVILITRGSSVYDFTVMGDERLVDEYLSNEKMNSYVTALNRMETGTMKHPVSGEMKSLVDWSGLREQVVLNLPPDVQDPVVQGAVSYEFGSHQPAALILLGFIDTIGAAPHLLPVSSYNRLLEAAGEEPATIRNDEAIFYLNPDFTGNTQDEMFSILERIAMDAQTRGKTLLSIDGQPIVLGSSVPMKGLTADENIKIVTALIVSDEVYYKYVAPDTVTVYYC